MSLGKFQHHVKRIRRRLEALGTQFPGDRAGPDLSHLTDEELERLDGLLARLMVQEHGPGRLRRGAHGPGGELEGCDCSVCQVETEPLTAEETNDLVCLLRVAHAD